MIHTEMEAQHSFRVYVLWRGAIQCSDVRHRDWMRRCAEDTRRILEPARGPGNSSAKNFINPR
jgi:hypothetical protein